MIVLKWEKYGSLWAYNGIPIYIGGKCITRNWMVWWWPWNWIVVAAVLPKALWRVVRQLRAP